MFENGNFNGIFYSRFIASWLRKGGKLKSGNDVGLFRAWLNSLGVDDISVNNIAEH